MGVYTPCHLSVNSTDLCTRQTTSTEKLISPSPEGEKEGKSMTDKINNSQRRGHLTRSSRMTNDIDHLGRQMHDLESWDIIEKQWESKL
jgi:hypothetical protein